MTDPRTVAQQALQEWYTDPGSVRMASLMIALQDSLEQPAPWVGLTEEEIEEAFYYVEYVKMLNFDRDTPEWCRAFAAAIEARLRRKNQ